MSNVKIKANASGTADFTIEAPATNSALTLTLPSESGTVLTTASPTGKVLQVVQAVKNTVTSTTSTSYTSVGLSASITPSSTSSKILAMVNGNLYIEYYPVTVSMTLYRDATDLANANGSGSCNFNFSNASDLGGATSAVYLDSPSTTSSVTYSVYYKTSTSTVYWGRNNSQSTLVLMEIAG